MTNFKVGDFVLLYDPEKRKKLVVRLDIEKKIHTQWGVIEPKDILSVKPGSFILSHTGKKLIVFRPKLYEIIEHSRVFKYATQIVRPRDWGLIITYANIRPGMQILEIGTGSGAFTAFLSEILGQTGKIISYEINATRAQLAKRNLEIIGVPKNYEIRIGNPSEIGIPEKNFDAAFIDIPEPWDVLNAVYDSLKDGSTLVCYIPTFNQVKKTLEIAIEIGFDDFLLLDHFYREIQVNPNAIRPLLKSYVFSAFIFFARKIYKH